MIGDAATTAGSGRGLPSGNLTFLFTDVEGSTLRWEREPEAMRESWKQLEPFSRSRVAAAAGWVVKGTGDGILAVFEDADRALAASVEIQLGAGDLPMRIALNTGEAEPQAGDYFGAALNRCHRVLAAAHGGQILITGATAAGLIGPLPEGAVLIDLGHHRLRGISDRVPIFQVGHPRLKRDFPRLATEDLGLDNLPVELTEFIGREKELDQAATLVEGARLVTLIGAGGSGKSRMAVRLAERMMGGFSDGVWLVPLADLVDGTHIPKQIARALGVPEEPGAPWMDTLQERLRHRQTLLVIDNCEHLLDAAAETADRLLRACSELKFLATSRQKLGVPGEAAFVVPPMQVPSLEDLDSPEAVGACDSVRLFVQRARLVDMGFELGPANAAMVGSICRAVDGIPLALELAAGKLGTLSIEGVAKRLGERLGVLAGGSRTGPIRHRTMRATLDWSYDLLGDDERTLLAQLSIFRGGFDLRACEEVCLVAGDTIEVLAGLIDKSLVMRNRVGGRFRLLEPVRVYAGEKLAALGRVEETAQRHARCFAANVDSEPKGIPQSQDQVAWLDRIEADHDNIRASIRFALDQGEEELALRLAAGSWEFWHLRGHLTEGRQWLERAIAAAPAVGDDLLALALMGAGTLAGSQGDDRAAEHYLRDALDLYRQRHDDVAAAAATRRLAALPHRRGDLHRAASLFEEALALAGTGKDLVQIGQIQASLALIYEDLGRAVDAETTTEAALATARAAGEPYVLADALLTSAELAINRNDVGLAEAALDEVASLTHREGFRDMIAWEYAYAGKAALVTGNFEEAAKMLEKGLADFQTQGRPDGEVWALRHLARMAIATGDKARAESLFRSAFALALEHVLPEAPIALQGLGEVAVANGDLETGLIFLSAADAAAGKMGLVRHPTELERAAAAEAAVRRVLGPEQLEVLRARGRALGLDAARELSG
jgi:predicted ATPase/class 3 adenylate cyclase